MRGQSQSSRPPAARHARRWGGGPVPRWLPPALLFAIVASLAPLASFGQEGTAHVAPPEVVDDEEAPPTEPGPDPEAGLGVESRTGNAGTVGKEPPAGKASDEDVARLFHARQVLARLGIRHLSLEGEGAGRAAVYRGQITAPALAFLGGLGDSGGGMPLFRSPVFVTLEGPGRIVLFVDIAAEIRGPGGQKTGVIVYDASRLPGAVQIVRRGW